MSGENGWVASVVENAPMIGNDFWCGDDESSTVERKMSAYLYCFEFRERKKGMMIVFNLCLWVFVVSRCQFVVCFGVGRWWVYCVVVLAATVLLLVWEENVRDDDFEENVREENVREEENVVVEMMKVWRMKMMRGRMILI